MFEMNYVTHKDQEFWFSLDRHLSKKAFSGKVRDQQGYVIRYGNRAVGILRYNLFWDSIPFVTLIHLDSSYHGKGLGKQAMLQWEEEMKELDHKAVMTSTQVDEGAQHFYRKLGYRDVGCLVLEVPQYQQPMEMFMMKSF